MTQTMAVESGAPRPALQTWRTTTAVRVFALALGMGNLISHDDLLPSIPGLVILLVVAVVSSLLEWTTRGRPSHWYVVGEAVVTVTLIISTVSQVGLSAYLAVPPIVAGVRHGLVTTVNVTLVSGLAGVATVLADPTDIAIPDLGDGVAWLFAGLGVGILASWQSRSTRDLAARQAPYAAAHHLMAKLHQLASSGSLGLNSANLAAELDAAMRNAVDCARSTVFVVEPDASLRALNGFDDAERLAEEIGLSVTQRTPGAAVVPLRGSRQMLGYCVLIGVPRWTPELDELALEVADEFAVRLDTAVLFDDVRTLATAEERNRIAREMHDGVAQEIVGLGYLVDELESISSDEQTRTLAASLRAEITRLVSEIRFSIFDLRHQGFDGRLSGTLADYAREIRQSNGLHVHVSLSESGPPLPSRTATEVLRIAQEAISNVRKHARASNMWITFDYNGSVLHLAIEDDGAGNALPRDHHWGLQTMRERAQTIGGQLDVTSRPDGGTVVCLRSHMTTALEGDGCHDHHRAAG